MVAWKSLISPMTVLIWLIAVDGAGGVGLDGLHPLGDVLRRPRRLLRQLLDLAGHDGEALAGLPRPRRLDGGVEASRLVCSAMPLISLMTVGDLLRGVAQLADGLRRVLRDRHGLTGHPGGLGGVVRDLADRRLHLRGAGGHGVDARGDRAGGGDDVVGLARPRCGRSAPWPRRRALSWVEAPASRPAESLTRPRTLPSASRVRVERGGHHAQLRTAADGAGAHREVTLGHLGEDVAHPLHRPPHAARDEQADHQREDDGDGDRDQR